TPGEDRVGEAPNLRQGGFGIDESSVAAGFSPRVLRGLKPAATETSKTLKTTYPPSPARPARSTRKCPPPAATCRCPPGATAGPRGAPGRARARGAERGAGAPPRPAEGRFGRPGRPRRRERTGRAAAPPRPGRGRGGADPGRDHGPGHPRDGVPGARPADLPR